MLFCKCRDSLKTHRKISKRTNLEMKEFKPHKNLLAQRSDDDDSLVDARVYSVPPVWVTLVDDLNRDLAAIESRVGELQTLSGKHLLPGFGEEEDQEEQIAHTVQELTTLFKESERRLKEIMASKSEASDEAVRKNIERRVAQQLQDLSIEFRRGHKAYLAKLKGQQVTSRYAPASARCIVATQAAPCVASPAVSDRRLPARPQARAAGARGGQRHFFRRRARRPLVRGPGAPLSIAQHSIA